MSDLLYFAYGSNLSIRRLQQRVASATLVDVACLHEHQLRFHKRNQDGSAKADCYFTGQPTDHVWGALFSFDLDEQPRLDAAEGLGRGYEIKDVEVRAENSSQLVRAFTYYATDIVNNGLPYDWYLTHVITGAEEVGLAANYLVKLNAVPIQQDADKERYQRELSIYN